jgi:acyl-CoA thioesterase FadM
MGACAWLARYPCLAAKLSIDFERMTPLKRDCTVEATIAGIEPKRLVVEARLSLDDQVLARGSGSFARIKREKLLAEFPGQGEIPDLSGYEFAG